MLLYIIRHGIPDYTTDTLTDEGRPQAEAVVRRLRDVGIERIFSSPMGRAQETAAPTARALGLPVEICPFMSERVAGNHFFYLTDEGKHRWMCERRELVLSNPAVLHSPDAFSHGVYADDALARQGFAELAAASDAFMAELGYVRQANTLAYRQEGKTYGCVAAFCHAGFGLHWLAHLLGLPPHVFFCTFDYSHTGITLIQMKTANDGLAYPHLLQHSDLTHIAMADLPYLYNNEIPI